MLVKQELIKKIKDYFDLNIYETKVWLALLGKGVGSAGEIAEISGVPRSRAYDVLESLEKKGFAIIKIGKPVKYLGVKPKVILEKLKNNVKKDAEDKINTLAKIKDTDEFSKIQELYKEGIIPTKREDYSAALRGRSNISNFLREVIQESKKEVIICADVEDLMAKAKLFKQTFDSLKNSGVKITVASSGKNELIKKISDFFEVKIKQINVDAKFFIIDRKEMIFYLSKNAEEETAIWLNSEFFAQAFANLFDKAVKVK